MNGLSILNQNRKHFASGNFMERSSIILTNKKTGISIILIVAISSFMAINCSIVGLGIGTAIDHSRNDYEDIDRWDVGRAVEGRQMIIYLNDGSFSEGKYAGMIALPDSVYNNRYYGDLPGTADQLVLPPISDTVEIMTSNDNPQKFRFRCFIYKYKKDSRKIVFFPGLEHQYVLAKPLDRDDVYAEIPLAIIRSIKLSDGTTISGDALRTMHSENSLPLKTAIKLQIDSSSSEYCPINEIEHVSIPKMKNTALILFFGGLLFDAALVIFVTTFELFDNSN